MVSRVANFEFEHGAQVPLGGTVRVEQIGPDERAWVLALRANGREWIRGRQRWVPVNGSSEVLVEMAGRLGREWSEALGTGDPYEEIAGMEIARDLADECVSYFDAHEDTVTYGELLDRFAPDDEDDAALARARMPEAFAVATVPYDRERLTAVAQAVVEALHPQPVAVVDFAGVLDDINDDGGWWTPRTLVADPAVRADMPEDWRELSGQRLVAVDFWRPSGTPDRSEFWTRAARWLREGRSVIAVFGADADERVFDLTNQGRWAQTFDLTMVSVPLGQEWSHDDMMSMAMVSRHFLCMETLIDSGARLTETSGPYLKLREDESDPTWSHQTCSDYESDDGEPPFQPSDTPPWPVYRVGLPDGGISRSPYAYRELRRFLFTARDQWSSVGPVA